MRTVRTKTSVFDSWSILAYLEGEPAAQTVTDIFAEAQERRSGLLMSVVNLGEVWYILARKTSEKEADQAIAELDYLGIEAVGIDWPLSREAAKFKTVARMSYADCFAAALAKLRGSALVTGDPDFKQVEGEIDIVWLKKR